MDVLTLHLYNKDQARIALRQELAPFLAAAFPCKSPWVLTVKRQKRTQKQNKRYWGNGVLSQIATQAVINGRQYSTESWHELFKRMFIGVEELPDGSVIGKSSTALTTVEFSEFCTQVEAYAATSLGVTFYELAPKQ